jgi:hypothetical protein
MLSDFIVNHPDMPLFVLTDAEYKRAIKDEPWLKEESKLCFLKK